MLSFAALSPTCMPRREAGVRTRRGHTAWRIDRFGRDGG